MPDYPHNTQFFDHLYRNYKDSFVHFAKTYVYNVETAEDIVMESFLYYLEKRSTLTDENIPSYILTVIKNKCLNYLIRLRKQYEIGEYLRNVEAWELNLQIATLEACNPERLFSHEVRKIINETLAKQPQLTREIFIRSRFKEESHKEIAKSLNLSTKSIEYHLTKVLKVLRVALKDYFPFIIFFNFFP